MTLVKTSFVPGSHSPRSSNGGITALPSCYGSAFTTEPAATRTRLDMHNWLIGKTPADHGRGHGLAIAVAVVGSALVIAACGSSAKSTERTAGSSAHAEGVKYSDCMRSHGVPDFPDPSPGGGFPLRTSGINQQSPAFQSSESACAKLQPGGNTPPPPISAAQQAGMVANARCIREHGVPNFPDPSFGPGGEGAGVDFQGNASSPAFQRAAKACGHVGTLIPGVGVG